MRIRKRFLSLSAAITAQQSLDLHVGNNNQGQQPQLMVQHQELHPNDNQQIGDCSHPSKTKIFKELESDEKKELFKIDDASCKKESITCGEAVLNHDLVLKGWLEGDRLVPVKKKRGSNGKRFKNDDVQDNDMIVETVKPKRKKNDKLLAINLKNAKSEKKEGVIMEGSRCSRVNGRGWRCSQQTPVGYSLCEHHLGKGRLRSNTSVRGRKVTINEQCAKESRGTNTELTSVDCNGVEEDEEEEEEDEKFEDWDVESVSSLEGSKVFSKKTKAGVVKARSLSSLLSQISS